MKMYDAELERVSTRYGRLYVIQNDSVIGRSLKLYGEWAENEIDSYATLLTNDETILDVGSNIGTHAIALASRFPGSEVVAFEPQPLAFSLLVANALAARTPNIYPRNLGCAETEGLVHVAPDYSVVDWNVGGFSLRPDQQSATVGALPIALVALDDLKFRRRVQFIKIDVEGMEESVLAGASKLIEQDRPIIYFEVLEMDRLKGPRKALMDLGYELRWLKSEAFNPRNYRLNPDNIWRRGETGVLAMPRPNDTRVAHLAEVTGDEAQVPVIEYPGA
jgi:FkbM family methyltransferase